MDDPETPRQRTAVLILDQLPDHREMFTFVLAEEGYAPTAVASLVEALGALQSGSVRAIIVDCVSGPVSTLNLAFLGELRRVAPGVPIILCSARPGTDRVPLEAHGLFAVVAKPFDLERLLTVVEEAARVSSAGGMLAG